MTFSSIPFLCAFFPAVTLLYYLIPSIKLKNLFLVAVSLLFYAYGEGIYVLLMIVCTFLNYLSARLIGGCGRIGKPVFFLVFVLNLGMLGVYKYAGMAAVTLNRLFSLQLSVPEIHLPIGISFFTFQALSYVADVYRGKVAAERSFFKVLLYISFFPQLIAGPIIKYHSISQQLEARSVTPGDAGRGLRRFITGLSKKVLLSNTLGVAADYVFALGSDELGMAAAWIGAVSYMLQIYFDFSGYSDMAIGIGRMFGFTYAENFRVPYAAGSIQDFWRRWHISLTGWFREYLYIPLGGNRRGRVRTLLNRVAVFFFTGLWHGANWTFVLWGLFHGAFLMLETAFPRLTEKMGWLRHIYVLLAVCVGFVLFRADTVGQAGMVLTAMFTKTAWTPQIAAATAAVCDRLFLFTLPVAAVLAMPAGVWLERAEKRQADRRGFRVLWSAGCYLGSLFLLLACVMSLAGGTYNPFIYFRF